MPSRSLIFALCAVVCLLWTASPVAGDKTFRERVLERSKRGLKQHEAHLKAMELQERANTKNFRYLTDATKRVSSARSPWLSSSKDC